MRRLLAFPVLLLSAVGALLGAVTLVWAASLNVQINSSISGSYRGANDLGAAVFTLNQALQPPIVLGTGTAANQADLLFSDQRTIAASSSENLDVAGGLTDPLGSTLTFATIKAVRICALSTNTNNVVVGGAESSALLGIFADDSDKIIVKPGGCFLWVAPGTGAAVTASTGDILLIANSGSGTGVSYRVLIIGTSA